MIYKNGKDVLPPELLKELQKHIEGDLIYIPRKEENRVRWGEGNGTRLLIKVRNSEICGFYESGLTLSQLMERFHLSEDSIRKILAKRQIESRI